MEPTNTPCQPCPSETVILHHNRHTPNSPRRFIIEEEVLTTEFLSTINENAAKGCRLCQLVRQRHVAQYLRVSSNERPAGLLLMQPNYWKGPAVAAMGADHEVLFEVLRGWLGECELNHEECGRMGHAKLQRVSEPFVPRRLIEITKVVSSLTSNVVYDLKLVEQGEVNRTLHLMSTAHSKTVRYATLSYMWGPTAHSATTTATNYEERRRTINFDSLPKTFQDAMTITNRLGISYIWIDALCIIQPTENDRLDWELQSAAMAKIYANSSITISASSSSHAHEGCLYERPDRKYPLIPVAFKPDRGDFTMDEKDEVHAANSDELEYGTDWLNPEVPSFQRCVLEAPLNSRGWVLQERFFAPRVAHFTKRGLFWECANLMASDYEPEGLRDREDIEANRRELSSRKTVDMTDGMFWLDLVRRYSELNLTDKQDVLPAISGVVHWMLEQTSDQFYAGIFRSKLLESLCWTPDEKRLSKSGLHKRIHGIPTWSWASVDSPVSFSPYLLSTWSASKPSWRIEITSVDVVPSGADPCGRVSSGRLSLCGIILSLQGRPHEMWRQSRNSASNHYISCKGNDYLSIDDANGHDHVFESEDVHKTFPFLVIMSSVEFMKRSTSGPSHLLACEGILLKPTKANREFERVGWLRLYVDDVDLNQQEKVNVTLV